MSEFTPLSALVGGFLIGFAAVALMKYSRQICGISGIIEGSLPPFSRDSVWRLLFIGGLLCGGVTLRFFYPFAFAYTLENSYVTIILAGFLVGFGSRLGKGCTSGHGVCGVGRVAGRSIGATVIFLATGIIVATGISFIHRVQL